MELLVAMDKVTCTTFGRPVQYPDWGLKYPSVPTFGSNGALDTTPFQYEMNLY